MTLHRRAALGSLAVLGAAPLLLRPGASLAATGDEYVMLTLEGGAFLKMTSEMALERATNEELRTFAELEVAEQDAVAAVLASTGMAPPAEVDGSEAEMMDRLSGLEGAEFDAAYLEAQTTGHQEALSIQEEMAAMEDITIPVATAKLAKASIESHLATLAMIAARM